jgi:hypothetical protein
MIANYQFKYWVFGVPGQQMGRALKLIAGSTGKLRLGFVSSCNEMKERRLLSKEDDYYLPGYGYSHNHVS